mmetsp:Transcript_37255/g.71430  ORF Transcript_37255/g.71430 Transcript_37255/m.71430 type:complete len:330 (-) Transcript_37255:198-1187(-)
MDAGFSFARDLRDLVHDFSISCQDQPEYPAFREVFVARRFALVHHARPSYVDESTYTQHLFSVALAMASQTSALSTASNNRSTHELRVIRHVALFALYTLYRTQLPLPRVKIYVSPSDLEQLVKILEEGATCGWPDTTHLIKYLMNEHAFLFGAVPSIHPLPHHPVASRDRDTQPQALRVADAWLEKQAVPSLKFPELSEVCKGYGEARHQVFVECEGGNAQSSTDIDVPNLFPSTFADKLHKVFTQPIHKPRKSTKEGTKTIPPKVQTKDGESEAPSGAAASCASAPADVPGSDKNGEPHEDVLPPTANKRPIQYVRFERYTGCTDKK